MLECSAFAMHTGRMKTSALPSIRVDPKTRRQAESLLRDGESLSSFVADALIQHIENRRAQEDFIARGMLSADKARRDNEYVSSAAVLRKLSSRLQKAKASK
jgi:predicted transcriptional regulator